MNQSGVLNGLVLAGGKSVRMGLDKGSIQWHGKEQRYYMADLLAPFCNDVFISCRPEQEAGISHSYKTLPDSYDGLGPYGGILSAFRQQPRSAWLVTACDLPLLDSETLQYLVQHRNLSSVATTFKSPHDGLPEPLITIWEPQAFPLLLQFLEKGVTCPRKVLINSNTTILEVVDRDVLLNANTPADADKVSDILYQRSMISHAG